MMSGLPKFVLPPCSTFEDNPVLYRQRSSCIFRQMSHLLSPFGSIPFDNSKVIRLYTNEFRPEAVTAYHFYASEQILVSETSNWC